MGRNAADRQHPGRGQTPTNVRRSSHAGPSDSRPREPPRCCRPSLRRSAGAAPCLVDAALDRHRRPGAGRRAGPDRRRAPVRRGPRHQVRDLRRAARARRDDRRAAARGLAARRPPSAPRARGRPRDAAPRAGSRAVAGRPRRQGRLRREAPQPHHPPHQHDRIHLAARVGGSPRRDLAAGRARAVRARGSRCRLRAHRGQRPRSHRDRVAAAARAQADRALLLSAK